MTLEEQFHVIPKDKLTLQNMKITGKIFPHMRIFHCILVHVQVHAPLKGKNAGR